jgi:hypothetical protein
LQNPKFSHHKIKERGRNERLGGQIKWIYSSLTGFTKKVKHSAKKLVFSFLPKRQLDCTKNASQSSNG